jgi:hypothetical protein
MNQGIGGGGGVLMEKTACQQLFVSVPLTLFLMVPCAPSVSYSLLADLLYKNI